MVSIEIEDDRANEEEEKLGWDQANLGTVGDTGSQQLNPAVRIVRDWNFVMKVGACFIVKF